MKILDTNHFVSERVKVKPVTNAEWKKVQKEYKNLKDLSFTKDCITCGTIVMFHNKTLGVYVDGDIAHEVKSCHNLSINYGEYEYFLVYNGRADYKTDIADYAYLKDYDDELSFHGDDTRYYGRYGSMYIIRIYEKPLTIHELYGVCADLFYETLESAVESRKYIERK